MSPKAVLLSVLGAMPDEAFGYVVLACQTVVKDYGGNGGFQQASQDSFKALGEAVDAYFAPADRPGEPR